MPPKSIIKAKKANFLTASTMKVRQKTRSHFSKTTSSSNGQSPLSCCSHDVNVIVQTQYQTKRKENSEGTEGIAINVIQSYFMGNTCITDNSETGVYPKVTMHYKCRGEFYPRTTDILRFKVPDDKLSWDVDFPVYKPQAYTSPAVVSKPVWADLDYRIEDSSSVKWNQVDGKVDRRSFQGPYALINGIPRNPIGRTGIIDRGTLGRWGPNHAADPIVTRWKRHEDGNIFKDPSSAKPILQFVAILRAHDNEWAIPGGMVDPGENVSVTLKREFSEEAMNILEKDEEMKCQLEKNIVELFSKGQEVYKGYVDDPRNTDNSWMETVAVNFHDDTGDSVGKVDLNAGDDAVGVQWKDISSDLKLFASHFDFIKIVAEIHCSHW